MDKALWLTFWGPPCMSCHQRRTIEHRAEIHSQNDWIISSHQKRTQQPEKQTTTGIITNYKYTIQYTNMQKYQYDNIHRPIYYGPTLNSTNFQGKSYKMCVFHLQ